MDTLPDLFEGLYGNERLKVMLTHSISAGTLSHAYILDGAEGSGRNTAALLIAAALAYATADDGNRDDLRRRVLEGLTGDIVIVDLTEKRKSIVVDQIREVKEAAIIRPGELNCRVFIIRHAETMNQQAQNCLLKLLEEPPHNQFFLLICSGASNLLPTIRSRAPVIRMQVFSHDVLSDYLIANYPKAKKLAEKSPDRFAAAIRTADGRIGSALENLSKADQSAKARETSDMLISTLANGGRMSLFRRLGELPVKREELTALAEAMQLSLRDIIAAKYSSETSMLSYDDTEDALNLSERFTAAELLRLNDVLVEAYDSLQRNANISLWRVSLLDALSSV